MADKKGLRQAQVSERDVNTATARVAMDDFNGHVSGKLQVIFPAIGGWNMFYTPKEGDHVVIARLPNGQQEGYVLGKVYTGNKMPQGGEPNILLLVSDDGKNVIKFDADKGTLDLVVDQDASIKCKNINIEVDETANITTKNANVKASENISIEAEKDINIKADQNVKIEAKEATIKTTGDTTVEATGKVTVKGMDVNVEATTTATVKAVTVKITGGKLEVNCAQVKCLFTGVDHVGNAVAST